MCVDSKALLVSSFSTPPGNIVFNSGVGPEITFEWTDSMFNVIYDADKCTQTAKNFFECMLPYLNEHIKEAASEREHKMITRTKLAIAELRACLDNSRDSQSKRALIEDAIRLLKRKES